MLNRFIVNYIFIILRTETSFIGKSKLCRKLLKHPNTLLYLLYCFNYKMPNNSRHTRVLSFRNARHVALTMHSSCANMSDQFKRVEMLLG